MKKLNLQGITYIELLEGSHEWYWGSDYTEGDLYEAEELYRSNHSIKSNRLVFIHYPDGTVIEPMKSKVGQYFGKPIFFDDKIQILLVDFPKSLIQILQYDHEIKKTELITTLSLSATKDCYNLLLYRTPLMLTRSAHDNVFQILYPQKVDINISETESFCYRENDRLYFERWIEDPSYRNEIVVRKYPSGEILEVIPGSLLIMPDGQKWIL